MALDHTVHCYCLRSMEGIRKVTQDEGQLSSVRRALSHEDTTGCEAIGQSYAVRNLRLVSEKLPWIAMLMSEIHSLLC